MNQEYEVIWSNRASKDLEHIIKYIANDSPFNALQILKKIREKAASLYILPVEVKYEGNWKEVVRYDCAHGYAHRDSYNLLGNHTKEELYLSFEDALTLADDDIDDNWETYKHKFLEGDLP